MMGSVRYLGFRIFIKGIDDGIYCNGYYMRYEKKLRIISKFLAGGNGEKWRRSSRVRGDMNPRVLF